MNGRREAGDGTSVATVWAESPRKALAGGSSYGASESQPTLYRLVKWSKSPCTCVGDGRAAILALKHWLNQSDSQSIAYDFHNFVQHFAATTFNQRRNYHGFIARARTRSRRRARRGQRNFTYKSRIRDLHLSDATRESRCASDSESLSRLFKNRSHYTFLAPILCYARFYCQRKT